MDKIPLISVCVDDLTAKSAIIMDRSKSELLSAFVGIRYLLNNTHSSKG